MSRPLRPTTLASLLAVLACATAPEPEPGDSTTTSQPGPSTAAPADPAQGAGLGVERPRPVATPVPVASAPDEARPCERMCGLLGDCLREGGDTSETGHLRDAGHLELTCLDLCVNVDTSSAAGQRFHACERHHSCGPLLDCTRGEWDAAAAARNTIVAQVDAAPGFSGYNNCELVCGGMYACMDHGQPLHQLQDPGEKFERDVKICTENCDPHALTMVSLAECAHEQTCAAQWDCWQRAQGFGL